MRGEEGSAVQAWVLVPVLTLRDNQDLQRKLQQSHDKLLQHVVSAVSELQKRLPKPGNANPNSEPSTGFEALDGPGDLQLGLLGRLRVRLHRINQRLFRHRRHPEPSKVMTRGGILKNVDPDGSLSASSASQGLRHIRAPASHEDNWSAAQADDPCWTSQEAQGPCCSKDEAVTATAKHIRHSKATSAATCLKVAGAVAGGCAAGALVLHLRHRALAGAGGRTEDGR